MAGKNSVVWELARRLGSGKQRRLGRLGARLAVGSIALAVLVMEIGTSIATGFDAAITEQLVGLTGDIQIAPYRAEYNLNTQPIARQPEYLSALQAALPPIRAIYPVARKAAILQGKGPLEGVVLKGMPPSYRPSTLPGGLVAGRDPLWQDTSGHQEVVISQGLASLLDVQLGQKVRLFFLEKRVRARLATVVGLYETGLEEYDDAIVLCDLQLVQQLNNWAPDQVEVLEVHLQSPLDSASANTLIPRVNDLLPPQQEAQSIYQLYPSLLSWIRLQHQNVQFLIGIMLAVVIVNLAAALLIRVTEQTTSIGLLKAVGASPAQLFSLFLADTGLLLLRGLLWGNGVGLAILALQYYVQPIRLPADAYFVESVPIGWPWLSFLMVNVWVLLACLVSFVLPAWAVARLRPAAALRFA